MKKDTFIQIYLNTGRFNTRRIVKARLIKKNARSVVVELSDGSIISRKRKDVFSFRPTKRPPKQGVIITP